jgi:Uma2 family endonuclease
MTAEEYLAFERASDRKHQFFDGQIFDMSGGSREHSLIASNCVGELRTALKRGPCETHGSDLRIHNPKSGLYTYADALVVCGEPRFLDDVHDTLVNPILIVEVLSDSTEAYDRGDKLTQYRSIPTLRDYVLISQKAVEVQHYAKQDDGTWTLRWLGAGEVLRPTGVDAPVAVDDLYARVFPQAGGAS